MNIADVKELIKALDRSTLTSLSIDGPEGKLELKKDAVSQVVVTDGAGAPITPVAAAPAPASNPGDDFSSDATIVRAPLVGVAYHKPDPDAQPFVTVGQSVKQGDTLCMVEAMKMFNEIKAPCSGHVRSVLFDDGQLVEFDQPLFELGD